MNSRATDYPRCHKRNAVADVPVELGSDATVARVLFSPLFTSFNERERVAWDRSAENFRRDRLGIIPEQIEDFLARLDVAK